MKYLFLFFLSLSSIILGNLTDTPKVSSSILYGSDIKPFVQLGIAAYLAKPCIQSATFLFSPDTPWNFDNNSPEENQEINSNLHNLQYNNGSYHRDLFNKIYFPLTIPLLYTASDYMSKNLVPDDFSYKNMLGNSFMGFGLSTTANLIANAGRIDSYSPMNPSKNKINLACYTVSTIATGTEAYNHFKKSYELWNKGNTKEALKQTGIGTIFGCAAIAPFVINHYSLSTHKVTFPLFPKL